MSLVCPNLAFPQIVREGLDYFCNQIKEVLGEQLVSIILYGGLARGEYSPTSSNVNVMIVTKEISIELLDRVTPAVQEGVRDFRLAVMVLTEVDLHRSTDVFPTKFLDMKQHHKVLLGKEVLSDLTISNEHLRLRCEQEIKNLLLRLRQFYLHRMQRTELIESTMTSAIPSFLTNLSILLILKTGESPGGKGAIAEAAAYELGINDKPLQSILEIKYGNYRPEKEELKNLYKAFMTTVQEAADIVDRLPEETK
jgi:predicted nucleotidyltransferase